MTTTSNRYPPEVRARAVVSGSWYKFSDTTDLIGQAVYSRAGEAGGIEQVG